MAALAAAAAERHSGGVVTVGLAAVVAKEGAFAGATADSVGAVERAPRPRVRAMVDLAGEMVPLMTARVVAAPVWAERFLFTPAR